MKRRISKWVGGVLIVALSVNLLALVVSYAVPFHIHLEGQGRRPDLSYDMGSEIGIGEGTIWIHSHNTDEYRSFEFERTTLICALCVFLWSGIPGRLRLRVASIPEENGLCKKCGYDLRASPERCPECGTLRSSK